VDADSSLIKGLVLGVLIALQAARASDWSHLLENNPFLPSGSAQAPVQPVQSLELRGVVVEGGVAWFTIYDTAAGKWTTVRQGEEGDSLKVRSYDRARDSVVLDIRGKTVSLSLKGTANQSDGQGAAAANVASAIPRSHTQPALTPALSVAEAARLEQVVAEIRQRREEGKKRANLPVLTRS